MSVCSNVNSLLIVCSVWNQLLNRARMCREILTCLSLFMHAVTFYVHQNIDWLRWGNSFFVHRMSYRNQIYLLFHSWLLFLRTHTHTHGVDTCLFFLFNESTLKKWKGNPTHIVHVWANKTYTNISILGMILFFGVEKGESKWREKEKGGWLHQLWTQMLQKMKKETCTAAIT